MLQVLLAFILLTPPAFADDLTDGSKEEMRRARTLSVDEMKRLVDASTGAPAGFQTGDQDKLQADAMSELRSASSDVVRSLLRLEPMRERYRIAEDLFALEGERGELLRAVTQAQGPFSEKLRRLEMLKRRRQRAEFEKVARKGLRTGSDMVLQSFMPIVYADAKPKNTEARIRFWFPPGTPMPKVVREGLDLAYLLDEMERLDLRLRTALQEDEEAYAEARKSFERRRLRRRLAAGGAASGLLLAGAGLWFARARRRPASGSSGAGDVIGGNFRLERELGRGGMGLVFEATDLGLRRKVAVKRLREEFKQSPRDLEAFLAEARLVAALRHPHIVAIYAVVSDGPDVYLVFELVEGQPLNVALGQAGRLGLGAACELARQVGSALDFAHANGVLHRDLKPANVMLTTQGAAKVTDFGLAHRVAATVTRLTGLQSFGTPPYMAPEQELGTSCRESDLYSLGVMLYELVTGKLPFMGPNYLAQKREMLFVPPSQAAPGLPGALDDVIRRALDPEPERRYHCAAELAQALASLAP